MPFLGTLVNFLAVFLCGLLGSLMKKRASEKISNAIMQGMGICVVYIGIDGALAAAPAFGSDLLSDGLAKLIVMILSIALGTLIGALLDIDKWVEGLGQTLERKLVKKGTGEFARGFVSCSILFCVGAMAVNGSIADSMGDSDILLAKSMIDGVSCFVMASVMGIGCAISAFFVLAYQGILTLASMYLIAFLPASTITYMSVTGSLVIALIGTNLLGCTNVKTANMIPAIFLPALIAPLLDLIF